MELRRIVEAITQSLLEVPDTELAQQFRDDGRDPDQAAEALRARLLSRIRQHQQGKLRQAKEEYKRKAETVVSRRKCLSGTPAEWRARLVSIIKRHSGLGDLVTVRFRDLSELPDEEVASLLMRLEELGLTENGSKQV